MAQWVRKLQCRRQGFDHWGREDRLEEEMATHSSILAQKVSWTEEPGRLQYIASHTVGHDWSDLACTHISRHISPLTC